MGILFIGNSATAKNAWVPTSDEPMSSRDPIDDDCDRESHYMESCNITTFPDTRNAIDEQKKARKRNMKKISEKTSSLSKNIVRVTYGSVWNHS